ncbi:hypothetical protein GCM10011505_10440 [Tistrella bauzanensis]|uniref:Uncharacterized protein n=1 Tax=Tistrella bauzanensis TaxID=657419 RepID=A0ABQ1IAX7_9PROT|nr:hypothetical protein GCM10011505_10440 [Tistrella bauzanensis]
MLRLRINYNVAGWYRQIDGLCGTRSVLCECVSLRPHVRANMQARLASLWLMIENKSQLRN